MTLESESGLIPFVGDGVALSINKRHSLIGILRAMFSEGHKNGTFVDAIPIVDRVYRHLSFSFSNNFL